jgi:putative DNA primase/helicase
MTDKLAGLLKLAELGFRLHPLSAWNDEGVSEHNRGKMPVLKNWTDLASSENRKVQNWFTSYPDANWGLVTGMLSNVWVMDIDPPEGEVSLTELLNNRVLPRTPVCVTGSGGRHYYFKFPKDFIVRNVKTGYKGIDVRGEGGQVVVPGSIHAATQNEYYWEKGLAPWETKVAEAPKWLITGLNLDTVKDEWSNIPKVGEHIEDGGRNDAIFGNAYKLALKDDLTEDQIFKMMRDWMDELGYTEFDDSEIQKTVNSAYKRAEAKREKKQALTKNPLVGGMLFDDTANAMRLLHVHGENLIFVEGRGFHYWNGKFWAPDKDGLRTQLLMVGVLEDLMKYAMELIEDASTREVGYKLHKLTASSRNQSRIESALNASTKYIFQESEIVDGPQTRFLLNFKNGTLDMITGELRPHSKDDFLTKMVPYNYNPDAKCPFWENTLQLALEDNSALIGFMQRALGYSISGSVDESCLFVAWGEAGSNGKSTIMEAIQRVLGNSYAKTVDPTMITTGARDLTVLSSLAQVAGIRMVSMSEASENSRFSEALIKQLTGGDTIEAKYYYKDPFSYQPEFKLWLRTNDKPAIYGDSNAIWRRIKLIPFNRAIPKELQLPRHIVDEKLEAESEGILAWMVRGFQEYWKTHSLEAPEEIEKAVSDYRDENDVIRQFLDEHITKKPGATVARQVLYHAFTNWMKDNGFRYIMTSNKFGHRVGKILEQPAAEAQRVRNQVVWSNIELSEEALFGAL